MEKRLLRIGEASVFLGVHPVTMHVWEKKKILLPRKDGYGRRYYEREQIEKFARKRKPK